MNGSKIPSLIGSDARTPHETLRFQVNSLFESGRVNEIKRFIVVRIRVGLAFAGLAKQSPRFPARAGHWKLLVFLGRSAQGLHHAYNLSPLLKSRSNEGHVDARFLVRAGNEYRHEPRSAQSAEAQDGEWKRLADGANAGGIPTRLRDLHVSWRGVYSTNPYGGSVTTMNRIRILQPLEGVAEFGARPLSVSRLN